MTALPHRHSSSRQRVISAPGEAQLRLVWSRPTINRIPKQVYWQRRFVALLLAVLLVFGLWSAIQAGVSSFASSGRPAAPVMAPVASQTWTVQPGDTLWSIASKVTPQGKDVRPVVSKLSGDRGGRTLQVGEVIQLP